MDKLRELGRRALFVIRVVTGYEEKRIHAHRMQLVKKVEQAQKRKASLKHVQEQLILKEVRGMVEDMQNLNRKLEEMEESIEKYFEPINKNAEIIMNLQFEKEEKNMKEIMKASQEHAILMKHAAEQIAKSGTLDGSHLVEAVEGAPKKLGKAK